MNRQTSLFRTVLPLYAILAGTSLLPAQGDPACPPVEVGLTAPDLQRCDTSRYYLTYCNRGNETASDQLLELELDPELLLLDASLPYTANGSVLLFELGDLSPADCGTAEVTVRLSCDVPLGAAHCTTARVFPDPDCQPVWEGAELIVDGGCEQEQVWLEIANVGLAGMGPPAVYRLFADGVLLESNPFKLEAGEALQWEYPAQGRTFRLETTQVFGFPTESHPAVNVDGCGAGEQGFYSTGFVEPWPADDRVPELSVACVENGVGLPDKVVELPRGYGRFHLLPTNSSADFVVRFRNPLEQVVDQVSITLSLSAFFDQSSFHPYAWSLPWSFDAGTPGSITLSADGAQLPPGRSVYCRFRLDHLPDLAAGTIVPLFAEATVDGQGPFPLVVGWHEIGDDFYATTRIPDTSDSLIFDFGGGRGGDQFTGICAVGDSLLYLAGSSDSYGSYSADAWVVQTDLSGHGRWYNAFDHQGGGERIKALVPAPDGGCLLVGYWDDPQVPGDYLPDARLFALRVASDGQEVWRRLIAPGEQEGGGVGNAVVAGTNGNFLIAGLCQNTAGQAPFLLSLSVEGEVEWIERYPSSEPFFASRLLSTADGGYLLGGAVLGNQPNDFFLLKTGPAGALLWKKGYADERQPDFTSLCQSPDGGFLVAGHTLWMQDGNFVRTPYLLRVDPSGEPLWEETPVVGPLSFAVARDVAPAPGGGYFVAGDVAVDGEENNALLMRIDEQGTVLWTRNYDAGYFETAVALLAVDEHVAMVGHNESPDWLQNVQGLLYFSEQDYQPPVGLDEVGTALTGKVYPNPTADRVWVEWPKEEGQEWMLVDALGRIWLRGEAMESGGAIDLAGLPSGVYYLMAPSVSGRAVWPIVKY